MLGIFDGFLLSANLSISLLVIVAGAFLVLPASDFGLAISLPEAVADDRRGDIRNLPARTGRPDRRRRARADDGADARPLGRRGSYPPTGLNVLQCLGWSVFELLS